MMKKIKNSFEFIQINRIKNNQNCDCNSSDDCSCGSETDSIDTSSSEEENEVKTEKSEEKETLIEEILEIEQVEKPKSQITEEKMTQILGNAFIMAPDFLLN